MAKHSKQLRAQYEGIDRQAQYDLGTARPDQVEGHREVR